MSENFGTDPKYWKASSANKKWNFALNHTLRRVRNEGPLERPMPAEWKGFSDEKIKCLQSFCESNNSSPEAEECFANLIPSKFTKDAMYDMMKHDPQFIKECCAIFMDEASPLNIRKLKSFFYFIDEQQKIHDEVSHSIWVQVFPFLFQKAMETKSSSKGVELLNFLLIEAHEAGQPRLGEKSATRNDPSLIWACEQNNFAFVKLFVDRGYRLSSRETQKSGERGKRESTWREYAEIPYLNEKRTNSLVSGYEEEDDDVYDLQILRCMVKPSYVLACYLCSSEASYCKEFEAQACECFPRGDKDLGKDESSEENFKKKMCDMLKLEISADSFHHCPFNEKFLPQGECSRHMECNDPIFRCFDLAQIASKYASKVPEYTEEYQEIAEEARKLSVQLLDQCKNSKEVKILLSESAGSEKYYRLAKYMRYPRLTVAIEHNHKEFAGHVFCQQMLRKEWQGNVNWNNKHRPYKLFYFLFQVLLSPIHYLNFCFVAPGRDVKLMKGTLPPMDSAGSRMKRLYYKYLHYANSVVINLDIPLNRFLTYTGHYIIFLGLIFIAALKPISEHVSGHNEMNEFPWYLSMLCIYCVAMLSQDFITFANVKSRKSYWTFWRAYDIGMHISLFLYLAIRLAMVVLYPCYDQPDTMLIFCDESIIETRRSLDTLSSCFFAGAATNSFLRIGYWMQLNDKIGPVVINFNRVMMTFSALSFIINIVIFAYSIGFIFFLTGDMYRPLSQWNDTSTFLLENNDHDVYYHTYIELWCDLFWTILEPGPSDKLPTEGVKGQISQFMYMAYQITVVIVLLNLLIATMNSTIQKMEDRKQLYWKFARSRIWIEFFDVTATTPPPFTALSFVWFVFFMTYWSLRSLFEAVLPESKKKKQNSKCKIDLQVFEKRNQHADLYQHIIKRFFKKTVNSQDYNDLIA